MIRCLKTCLFAVFVLHSIHRSDENQNEEPDTYDFITVKPEYIIQPVKNHTGTVIFLHGMIDTDPGIEDLKKAMKPFMLDIAHIKIIFPRAPHRPYSLMNEAPRYIWFNRKWITIYEEEDLPSFEMSCIDIQKLIANEVKAGIPFEKILLGGFSMGGEMALHIAYRYMQNLTGVFAISAFLRENSEVLEHLYHNDFETLPELFLAVGTRDDVALAYWVEDTFNKLQDVRVHGNMHIMKDMEHEVREDVLEELWGWVLRYIPDHFGKKRRRKFLLESHYKND
ncbi:lysophospholipase-like protein 1 [Planococcus citri]|uniref:lysophospholipase-like protein 1 n=1 Tax=Planococcus citri TaxID=170843 RepID=UPI0031F967C0